MRLCVSDTSPVLSHAECMGMGHHAHVWAVGHHYCTNSHCYIHWLLPAPEVLPPCLQHPAPVERSPHQRLPGQQQRRQRSQDKVDQLGVVWNGKCRQKEERYEATVQSECDGSNK